MASLADLLGGRKIPKAFPYRGMICVFGNMNLSTGVLNCKLMYDKVSPDEFSYEAVMKSVESDPYFSLLISMYYGFTCFSCHAFMKVDDEKRGTIFVTCTGMDSVTYFNNTIKFYNFSLNNLEDTIYRVNEPITRTLKTYTEYGDEDGEYERTFIVDTGITAIRYSHHKRKCSPYIIRVAFNDTTDTMSLTGDIHKDYNIMFHMSLYGWLIDNKESPLHKALDFLSKYLSPTETIDYKMILEPCVLADRYTIELLFVAWPFATNRFTIMNIDIDHLSIRMTAETDHLSTDEKTLAPIVTYTLSNDGLIFVPIIGDRELIPAQYYQTCYVRYMVGGVILDQNLIYDEAIMSMIHNQNYQGHFVDTIQLDPDALHIKGMKLYVPISSGEFIDSWPMLYFKIPAQDIWTTISKLIREYTSENIVLTIVSESNAGIILALSDKRDPHKMRLLHGDLNYEALKNNKIHYKPLTDEEAYHHVQTLIVEEAGDTVLGLWQHVHYYKDKKPMDLRDGRSQFDTLLGFKPLEWPPEPKPEMVKEGWGKDDTLPPTPEPEKFHEGILSPEKEYIQKALDDDSGLISGEDRPKNDKHKSFWRRLFGN